MSLLDAFDPDAPAGAADGLFGLPFTEDDAAVLVLPVPWEPTTSYRKGTAHGPRAVARASMQVDLHDLETGDPWRSGIALADPDRDVEALNAEACTIASIVHQAGGVDPDDPDLLDAAARVDALADEVEGVVHRFTASCFARGRIPAILGGDHSVPLGAMIAAAERYPGLGILHVDAHADLRVAFEGFRSSHASILYNVLERAPGVATVVQVGLRDVSTQEVGRIGADPRLHGWFDPEIAWELAHGTPWATLVGRMIAPLPEHVWITFDIDGLDPAFCPRTGTPVPGGLSWRDALVLLRALAHSGRTIVGFDLCEVAVEDPDDPTDAIDAIVGARLLYKLAGHALATQRRG
jgi:agmatinase